MNAQQEEHLQLEGVIVHLPDGGKVEVAAEHLIAADGLNMLVIARDADDPNLILKYHGCPFVVRGRRTGLVVPKGPRAA